MKSFLKTRDYPVTGEDFQLLYDEQLDMLITNPEPQDLSRYYNSDTYISHTDSQRTPIDKLYQYIKKYSLWRKVMLINRYGSPNKTLLDIGAGTGDFLRAARHKGWAIDGVEPNRMARGKASEKAVELLDELDAISGQKFQVITLWHVLEHLPNLEEQVKKIISLLGEEGTIIIAVPNYKSFDAKYYKNFWAAYDVPRHLWHFSRTAIERLFSMQGMQVVKMKPMIFDAFYVSLLSEKYKTGHQNFIKAFFIGLWSNISAWRTREYSSQLYIIQKA